MATGTFSLSNLQVRGRVGDLVFLPQSDGRVIVRRVPTDLPARTAPQRESEARMRLAAAHWQALTIPEGEAWARWAEAQGRRAYPAFLGLAAKRLQMFPGEPVPRLPPTGAFLGDGVVVTVAPSPTAPPSARPSLQGEPAVLFCSSGPNSEGILTELLLQKLRGAHRKPVAKGYTSRGFVAFAPGTLTAEVPCAPGAYACAARFVRAATGQETGLLPLGRVVVGAAAG